MGFDLEFTSPSGFSANPDMKPTVQLAFAYTVRCATCNHSSNMKSHTRVKQWRYDGCLTRTSLQRSEPCTAALDPLLVGGAFNLRAC